MEINPGFNKYMDRYFEYAGQWDSPSKCGLRVVHRKDGTVLAIATEIYRQNPGTPVTEWCAQLATQVMKSLGCAPDNFVCVEHTPDLKSKLAFYEETFDLLHFHWNGESFIHPQWTRLSRDQVSSMLEA